MDIERRIREYLDENVLYNDGGVEYEDDASLLAAGVLDSMSVLELVRWIESTFELKTDLREVTRDNFDSIERLANYIRRKTTGACEAAHSAR